MTMRHFFLAPGLQRPGTAHLIIRLLSHALWQHEIPPGRIYDLKIYCLVSPQIVAGPSIPLPH